MSSIVYRNLDWSHYAAAKDLFRAAFALSEWECLAPSWRNRRTGSCFSAWYKDLLVGFSVVDNENTIKYICVHPDYQGFKIGSVLLTMILTSMSHARSIRLTTAGDKRLMVWYGRHGFKPDYIYAASDGTFLGAAMIRRQRSRSAAAAAAAAK